MAIINPYVEGYRLHRHSAEFQWHPPQVQESFLKVGFLNILSTYGWHTRGQEYRESVPQFNWASRCPAIMELIAQERPAVLGLCELDLIQTQDLEKEIKEGRLKEYQLIGFSTQTAESLEEAKRKYPADAWKTYGTFVAALVNRTLIEVKMPPECEQLPTHPGQTWQTVLMKVHLVDKIANQAFVFLVSHFDYHAGCTNIREQSCDQELRTLRALEQQGIPYLSVGDRNWSPKTGEEEAKRYIASGLVTDMRDDNQYGCFGLPGTFVRDKEFVTIDTGYRSRGLTEGVVYYTRAGKYDLATKKLLPDTAKIKKQPNTGFVSDHFMFIAVVRFK